MEAGSTFCFLIHALLLLLLLQCERLPQGSGGGKAETRRHHDHMHDDDDEPAAAGAASLKVFFKVEDLKMGRVIELYFPIKKPSTTPNLLPREEADRIPFSSSQLPYLLDLFGFDPQSDQAKAVQGTLYHCEFPPLDGETKFCATSLESMLDNLRDIFGQLAALQVLTTTTTYINNINVDNQLLLNSSSDDDDIIPSSSSRLQQQEYHMQDDQLQNYTILSTKRVQVTRMLGCHILPYPYAVFYCHGQRGDTHIYVVTLRNISTRRRRRRRRRGQIIEAVGVCHMDTSHWDPNHIAFKVLGAKPGTSAPICHVFPPDNMVWIPKSHTSTAQ
ncbi:hypothetical protein Dimus_025502 [Dionaea muscipula]